MLYSSWKDIILASTNNYIFFTPICCKFHLLWDRKGVYRIKKKKK